MAIDRSSYSRFLEKIAEDIDIQPSKYQDAVNRYRSVGQWLEGGEFPGATGEPLIYPQGSFRLGTVVRPVRDGLESNFDIDLVCELSIRQDGTSAASIKAMVGKRLREHGTYQGLLDVEGKRCWTLEYAEQDGVGFHLDILPAVPDRYTGRDTAIAITNKDGSDYTWSASDPRGYASWFESMNRTGFEQVQVQQKRSIQMRASAIYASIDDVPDQLVRTPLQRTIQILKRHRDMTFSKRQDRCYSPISIIITTLAAQLYQGEMDLYSALNGVISRLHAHSPLVHGRQAMLSGVPSDLVRRTKDGRWFIPNPVNPDENFADRWHEDDHVRARLFFWWVEALKRDLIDVVAEGNQEIVRERLQSVVGDSIYSRHCGLLIPISTVAPSVPKIHISKPAKPWGCG